MRFNSGQEFIDSGSKTIVLIGMSGVGKTFTANLLPKSEWFRYSVDYHIGVHYLYEDIANYFETKKNDAVFINDLLIHNSIDGEGNPLIMIDNIYAVSAYLGMLGDTERGGLSENEFRGRLAKHNSAEIDAMMGLVKAKKANPNMNLVIDSGGSLCEIIDTDNPDDTVIKMLEDNCTVVYIHSDESHLDLLADRQEKDPKPLYYRSEFLDKHLPELESELKVDSISKAKPSDVARSLFPRLLKERKKRYEKLAERVGYTITMEDSFKLKSEKDLMQIIAKAIDSK